MPSRQAVNLLLIVVCLPAHPVGCRASRYEGKDNTMIQSTAFFPWKLRRFITLASSVGLGNCHGFLSSRKSEDVFVLRVETDGGVLLIVAY